MQAEVALLKQWGAQLDAAYEKIAAENEEFERKFERRYGYKYQPSGAAQPEVWDDKFTIGGRTEGPNKYFVPSHGYKAVRTDGPVLLRFMQKRPVIFTPKQMQEIPVERVSQQVQVRTASIT
jgi:hypothetical protein